MKKRGFTLIELLAVIVVLAIIALIATPIVMNLIKNAQMGAAERSADNYLKAVETLIATEKLDGTPVADGEYKIDANGNLTFGNVEVSGTKPNGGTIKIENGQVVKDESSIEVGNYTVTYEDGKAKAEEPNTSILCKAIAPVEQDLPDKYTGEMVPTVVGVQATEENKYAKGAVYQCDLGDGERIFYVLKDTKDTVSLLMEENIGVETPWCEGENIEIDDGYYEFACSDNGETVFSYLISQTSEWKKLFDKNGTVSVPSPSDMSVVNNQDWMRINLGSYPAVVGYWLNDGGGDVSARVYYSGAIESDYTDSYDNGVRPMITISKENISL